MQFSAAAAVLALAASASAWSNGTVVYTTEVHTAYTTVCPASTTFSFNGVTYTATASQTITVTNCPCTVTKPVTTASSVYCATCTSAPAPPVYTNGTTPVVPTTVATSKGSVGTSSAKSSATATPSTITASGGNKAFALSGASLAGLLGLAAYVL
eukprot:TRINITY_DN13548_c0_g1_i2.p1 TRINITY_DN13548_c0_g1~~TRINITY_DN13548_c0_g1_i2.p1  ORF type:complete len:155 (+),score=13.09 TRINITY_DN13548_c0_g1_i2:138-602(+)